MLAIEHGPFIISEPHAVGPFCRAVL
jgi:hypothetical protein